MKTEILKSKSSSQGLTLVELMVSMTIGLFLVLALTLIYTSIKKTFLNQNSTVKMQESYRLIFSTLSRSIQTAGYIAEPYENGQSQHEIFPQDTIFNAGQFIKGVDGDPKKIIVRYQSVKGDGILSCNGSTSNDITGRSGVFTNTFSFQNNKLTCTSQITSDTGVAAPEVTTIIADHISNINFVYGLATGNNDIIDSYVSADAVGASNWNKVASVRFSIKFIDRTSPGNTPIPHDFVQYINLMNKIHEQ